jgi:RND family efflux transporter MFP subunit
MRNSEWPMRESALALASAVLFAVAGCEKKAAPKAAPAPHVVVTAAVQRDEPITREWIGTTEGEVNAEIRPKVDGYLLRRVYQEGSFVRTGDLLFEIDPRQANATLAQAEANLEQAKAGLAKTEHDVARYEPLAAQKALSEQELDNARSAERAAKATVGALKAAVEQARLSVAWARVTSPIDGIAGLAQRQVGDLVGPQTVMTTVSKVDPLRVLYQMSEQEYLQLHKDPAMRNAPLELVLADGSAFQQKGHVLLSGREVDVKTGTITTVGTFPNPGNVLRPGQYAKVRAVTHVKRGAVLVPQRAVNEMQGAFQVAVVDAENKAQIRPVKTAERVGSLWIVDQGVRPGEKVVVEGFSKLKSGMAVVPEEAPPAAPATPASIAGK